MKKIILAIVATVFVSAQAYAFTGTISFGGTLSQSTKMKTGVTTNTFHADWTTSAIPPNTGAYAGVPGGITTTMNGFSFTGNNTLFPTLIGGPITPQWTFTIGTTTYSFNLEALLSASTFKIGNLTSIAETGTG